MPARATTIPLERELRKRLAKLVGCGLATPPR
jgi:hypothetical protein